MKIKDLQQYKKIITGQELTDSPKLGTAEDLMYSRLVGEGTNLGYHIGNISNFAEHSNTQLFYELLQNASDAKADTCYIRFDDQGFLVINNGEPFVADGRIDQPGRLRSFLAKNKGAKYESSEVIGEHGQGSKLLYDLFLPTDSDTTDHMNKAERLNRCIQQELRGLMLFSWSRFPDLQALMNWEGGIPSSGSCLDDEIPLLTKTIYTYYPGGVGERRKINGRDQVLFPIAELNDFIGFLKDSMSAPQVNTTNFGQGAAIYIQLGEGRAAKLREALAEDLKAGLSTSLALLPYVKRVQINDQVVEQTTSFSKRELELYPATDAHDRKVAWFYYPESTEVIDAQLANFFKYFPITKEVYGLKFILNSKEFDITNSRQNFNFDDEGNQKILIRIGEELANLIDELGEQENREDLLQIIKAVLRTDQNQLNRNPKSRELIKKYFFTGLIEAIKQNLPTSHGIKTTEDTLLGVVVNKNSSLSVTAENMGCEVFWIDEQLNAFAEELQEYLNIPSWNIAAIHHGFTDPEQWNTWVRGLSKKGYTELLNELQALPQNKLKEIPFLLFGDANVYSLAEVAENEQVVLLDGRTLPLMKTLDSQGISYGGKEIQDNEALLQKVQDYFLEEQNLLSKLIKLIDFSVLSRDEKWLLFRTWRDKWELPNSFLKEKVRLFQNKKGDLRPLGSLLKSHLKHAPSGILKGFQIHPTEILFDELDSYFLQEGEMWTAIKSNWHEVATQLKTNNYAAALADLDELFTPDEDYPLESDQAWLMTNEEDLATSDKVFFNEKVKTLEQDEYERLLKSTQRLTGLKMIDVDHYASIGDQAFAQVPSVGLKSWAEQLKEGSELLKVKKKELQVLQKCRTSNEQFFTSLKIKSSEVNPYSLIYETSGKQFFARDQKVAQFLNAKSGYYELPQDLFLDFKDDLGLIGDFDEKTEKFAQHLVDQFGSEPLFIDLIQKCSEATKKKYLLGVDEINLTASDEVTSYRNTFEGKLISLAVDLEEENIIQARANIDGKSFSDFRHQEKLVVEYDEYQAEFQLSILLPKYHGLTNIWQAVKDKLRMFKTGKLFDLAGLPSGKIASEIAELPTISSPDQVAFYVAFQQTEDYEPRHHKSIDALNWNGIDSIRVLDVLYKKKIIGFGTILAGQFFHPSDCIYAPEKNDFLLQEEQLPDWVISWLGDSQERLTYLRNNGLRNSEDPVIQFRELLKAGDKIEEEVIDSVILQKVWTDYTLSWVHREFLESFSYQSEVYSSLHRLIISHSKKHNVLPNMLIAFDFLSVDRNLLAMILVPVQGSAYYLNKFKSDELPVWQKVQEGEIGALYFDATYRKVTQEFRGLLDRLGLKKAELRKEFTPLEEAETQEWEATPYRQWKEKYNKYTISVTRQEIPFTYYFTWKEFNNDHDEKTVGVFPVGKAARYEVGNEQTQLILHLENPAGDSTLEAIKDNKEELFLNDSSALVELLSAFSVELDDNQRSLLDTANQEGLTPEDIQGFVNTVGRENLALIKDLNLSPEELKDRLYGDQGQSGYDLGKDLTEKEIDQLKALVEIADEEKLAAIIRNFDLIQQLLESDDKESKPSTLIGFIGEVLVYEWLKLQHGEEAVEYTAVERSNDRLKNTYSAYDLKLSWEQENYLIDVKTTIKSIRDLDRTVAFFIKKSQYEYITKYPDQPYYIYRISLQELGLYDFYQSLRVQPGQQPDDIINEHYSVIVEKVRAYLSNATHKADLKRLRMVFRVTIPQHKESIF